MLDEKVTHHPSHEVRTVVALEHQRCAEFGEQTNQGGNGRVRVGVAAGQRQQHAAGGQVADAQQVQKLAVNGDGWFGVVDRPDRPEASPGAGAVGLQAVVAVATPTMESEQAREFAFGQSWEVILQGGHTDGVAPEVHEVADLAPFGWRGDGGWCAKWRGWFADLIAPTAQGAHREADGIGNGGLIDAAPSSPAGDGQGVQAQAVFTVATRPLKRGSAFQVAGFATLVTVLRGLSQQVGMTLGASFVWCWWLVGMIVGRWFITGVFLCVVRSGWSCRRQRVLRAAWPVRPAPGVR